MNYPVRILVTWLLLAGCCALAQQKPPAPPPANAAPAEDYSGLYNFVGEGETLQMDVDGARVSGFVTRYGTLDSDRGALLDQFIKSGSLKGRQVAFTTASVHGTWFEFKGRVERGPGKTHADEGYYLLRGTLTESSTDMNKKVSARSREVSFKSFPQDEDQPLPARKRD